MKAFDKASLALVPDGIKDGKLYSIKPTDGSGDFTFTRGSNLAATRVDENGLIEKGRENIVLQSNNFDQVWVKSSSNVTSGQAGYDGTTDAWSVSKTAQYGRLEQTVTLAGLTTMSVYAKASINDWIAMRHTSDGSSIANFDLTNGVFGAIGSNVVATNSVSVGNGWYRVSVTWNYTGSSGVRIHPNASDSIGGTTATIFIQDVQVEQGLVATDYIETGATTAQAGVLENLPRIDYTGSTPSLLLEPSRTNFIPNSEYITELLSVNRTTITDLQATSPDGKFNAAKLIPSTDVNTTHQTDVKPGLLTNSYVSGDKLTISVFAKADGYDGIILRFKNNGCFTTNRMAAFDLSRGRWENISMDGTIGVMTGEVGMENYGNGWYRCYATATADATGISTLRFPVVDVTSQDTYDETFTGDNIKAIQVYGFQLEQGSYPTSYIPTYGASATRSGDLIQPKTINSTSNNTFTVFFELHLDNMPLVSNEQFLNLNNSTSNIYQSFRMFTKNGEHVITPYFNVDNTYAYSTNIEANRSDTGKVVFRANGDGSYDMFIRFNGTTTKRSASSLTAYNLGKIGFINQASKNFKSLLVFDDPLSDAECIRLTTGNLTLTKPAFVGGAGLNNFVVAVSGDIAGGSGTIETNWQWQISNDGNTWADVNGATNDYYTIPNNTNLLGKYIRVEQSINDEYGTLTVVASDGQQILQLAGLFDSVPGTAGYSLNRLRSQTPFYVAARVTRDGTDFASIGFTSNNLFDSAAAMAYATQTGNIAQYYFDEEFNINTFARYGGEIDALVTPFRGEENVLVYEVANDAVDDQRFFSKNILDPTLSHTIRVQAKVLLPSNQKVDKVRIWTGYSGEIFDEVTTTDVWVDVDQTLVVASGTNLRVQAYIDTNSHFYAPGDKFYIKDLIITDTTPNLHIQTLYDQSGNNNHAIQNAFQSMPKIIEDGVLVEDNGNPALKFDGVDDWLDAGLLSSQFSQVFVVKNTTGTGTTIGYSGAVSLQSAVYNTQNDDITFSSGSGLYTIDNLNVKGYLNGVDETGAATTFTQTFNRLYLGSVNGTYSFIDGKIQEYIHFPYASDQSKIREGIERVMANRYNIDLS